MFSARDHGAHPTLSQRSTTTLGSHMRGRQLDNAQPRRGNLRKLHAHKPPPLPLKEAKNESQDSDIEEFSSPEVTPYDLPPLVESDEIETSPERAVESGSDVDISDWSE